MNFRYHDGRCRSLRCGRGQLGLCLYYILLEAQILFPWSLWSNQKTVILWKKGVTYALCLKIKINQRMTTPREHKASWSFYRSNFVISYVLQGAFSEYRKERQWNQSFHSIPLQRSYFRSSQIRQNAGQSLYALYLKLPFILQLSQQNKTKTNTNFS